MLNETLNGKKCLRSFWNSEKEKSFSQVFAFFMLILLHLPGLLMLLLLLVSVCCRHTHTPIPHINFYLLLAFINHSLAGWLACC